MRNRKKTDKVIAAAALGMLALPLLSSSGYDKDVSGEENNNKDDNNVSIPDIFSRTDAKDWTCVREGEEGKDDGPIKYTGENTDFDVKITEEELEQLKDNNGNIRYYTVVEYLLPRFDGDSFWE